MMDDRWFQEIYNTYYKNIYRLAAHRLYTYTGSSSDAQDIVQEVFLCAAQKDIHKHANPGGWLIIATENACMNYSKKLSRRSAKLQVVSDPLPGAPPASDESEAVDTRLTLKSLLSPEEYYIITEHYIHRRSLADLASEMNVSHVAMRVRIHRIRSQLKKYFFDL